MADFAFRFGAINDDVHNASFSDRFQGNELKAVNQRQQAQIEAADVPIPRPRPVPLPRPQPVPLPRPKPRQA